MEYERIHKVQTGIISPSKLRMKLIGTLHHKRKDGSNNNSSRTSPARLEDTEFVKNSLLADPNGDFYEQASSVEIPPIKSNGVMIEAIQSDGRSVQSNEQPPGENGETSRLRMQIVSKGDSSNSSSVHPVRTSEDENLDYDSTSSFEFHKGERSLHRSGTRSFSRPMSSKWNDAEKWIMNRQILQSGLSKKANLQNQIHRSSVVNLVRVAPEAIISDDKASVKRVSFCPTKFDFASNRAAPFSGQVNGGSELVDYCLENKDLPDVTEDTAGVPAIREVSMRDMGTEMTPIPSQEPSRSVTPVSSTTPIRSPTSSIPSTPRREPAPTPAGHSIRNSSSQSPESGKKELTEQELKLKTRREIVALGVHLGKPNIAAWASKDEKEKGLSANEGLEGDEPKGIEYARRAAAWEEAEKSKHAARLKRDEIRIQAWESQQKAKLEAEMRKIEAQIEQMKAQAQAKMVKKIALTRQKSEEKRAAAEARKKREADRTSAQAEYIQETGRIPTAFVCCGW